ncbi:hypothetical protein ACFLSE_05655 [Bacteroidota bacterium]
MTDNLRFKTNVFFQSYLKVYLILAILLNLVVSCSVHKFSEDKNRKAESILKDRLWIWSHGEGVMGGKYGLPSGGNISPTKAAEKMGIPNVCMIRWLGKPEPPFDEYLLQFTNVKRFAWSVIDSAPETYDDKVRSTLEIAQKMPNLTTLYLDDFFIGKAVKNSFNLISGEYPAKLTVNETKELYNKLHDFEKPLDLAVVLYSNQIDPAIKKHLQFCDIVSYWTWNASDLLNLKDSFGDYQKMFPNKPTLLGIYMWDFGGRKPISQEMMEFQCEYALQLFKEGKIKGIIFHSSPLIDMNIKSVKWVKKWIKKNQNVIWNENKH